MYTIHIHDLEGRGWAPCFTQAEGLQQRYIWAVFSSLWKSERIEGIGEIMKNTQQEKNS
jgi:hypothetical protein